MMMSCTVDGNELNKVPITSLKDVKPIISTLSAKNTVIPPIITPPNSNNPTDHLTANRPILFNHHPVLSAYNNASNRQQRPFQSSRWSPTPEQLVALEELYRSGKQSPTAQQIQEITAKLRRFGKIEGKNVFYWFQNHKARDKKKLQRRKLLQDQAKTLETKQPEFSSCGSRVTNLQAEQTKGEPLTNCTRVSVKSTSTPRVAIGEKRTNRWVGVEAKELELIKYNTEEGHAYASWRPILEMSYSYFSDNCLLKKARPTVTSLTLNEKLLEKTTQEDCSLSLMPTTTPNFTYFGSGIRESAQKTLELFPLRSDISLKGGALSNNQDNSKMTSGRGDSHLDFNGGLFFEFLPLKN